MTGTTSRYHPLGVKDSAFGIHLKRELRRRGVTFEKLAYDLQCSRRTLARWRSGDTVPSIHDAIRLARVLSLDEEVVIQWAVESTYEQMGAKP